MRIPFVLPSSARVVALALASMAPFSPLASQTVGGAFEFYMQFDGPAPGDYLGHSVSGAGDVNLDGHDDFILGAPRTGGFNGSVFVHSGRNGDLLWQFDGPNFGDQLGWSVSDAGDVNQDGSPDFIAGAPSSSPGGMFRAGSAFVYSGADGSLLWRFDGASDEDQLGTSVSGIGDVNQDGFDDLIVGAPQPSPSAPGAGFATLYSGADGTVLWQSTGTDLRDFFGQAVSDAGDVNQDGFNDIIVGAHGADPGGSSEAGTAFVFSGASGGLLWRFDGATSDLGLGWSVSGAGDVNQDGADDLIVGAPHAHSAFVYSGADGTLLLSFDGSKLGPSGSELGYSVSGAGDLNQDGFDDLLIGAPEAVGPGNAEGAALVYSGGDGSLIWTLIHPADYQGGAVSDAGDMNQDGFLDVIAASHLAMGTTDGGSALVYVFKDILSLSSDQLSVSAGGTIDLDLDFPFEMSFRPYQVLASSTGTGPVTVLNINIPLTPDTLFFDTLVGNYPPSGNNLIGVLDPLGDASADLTAGPGVLPATLVGGSVFVAAVSWPASSLARTLTFVP